MKVHLINTAILDGWIFLETQNSNFSHQKLVIGIRMVVESATSRARTKFRYARHFGLTERDGQYRSFRAFAFDVIKHPTLDSLQYSSYGSL